MNSLSIQKGRINDDPASAKEIQKFIDDYGVNTDEIPEPLSHYKTMNEFFMRALKPGCRTIYQEMEGHAVISPCDCRVNAWENASIAKKVHIKGREFSVGELIGGAKAAASAGINLQQFEGGSFFVFRLAPTDYHRFHAPFDCTVLKEVSTGQDLYSVKTYAINSRINVLTDNKRVVVFLKSPVFGEVAYVTVGATQVGSIHINVHEGQELKANDEFGYFCYGGSTVCLVFKANSGLKIDSDLITNSEKGVETLVQLGNRLAIKTD